MLQTIAANMSGELQLRIETEDVTATTYFRDLQNHVFGESAVRRPLRVHVW